MCIYIYIYILYIYATWCYIRRFARDAYDTKKRHRQRAATWCYIGRFVRNMFKQTCNTSPPQGVEVYTYADQATDAGVDSR